MRTVTSRFSLTIVQRDCTVYMAEPSASSASTFRSGQATAAPSASGNPCPIAPPVSVNQSCGAALLVMRKAPNPLVAPSSETMAPSGSRLAMTLPSSTAVIGPCASSCVMCWATLLTCGEAPRASAKRLSASIVSTLASPSLIKLAVSGESQPGFSG